MTEILQAEKDVLQILKYDLNRDDPTIWINYFIYNMKIENCEVDYNLVFSYNLEKT